MLRCCNEQLPEVIELVRDGSLRVIAISYDEDAETAREHLREHGIDDWTALLPRAERPKPTDAVSLDFRPIPFLALVDEQGQGVLSAPRQFLACGWRLAAAASRRRAHTARCVAAFDFAQAANGSSPPDDPLSRPGFRGLATPTRARLATIGGFWATTWAICGGEWLRRSSKRDLARPSRPRGKSADAGKRNDGADRATIAELAESPT